MLYVSNTATRQSFRYLLLAPLLHSSEHEAEFSCAAWLTAPNNDARFVRVRCVCADAAQCPLMVRNVQDAAITGTIEHLGCSYGRESGCYIIGDCIRCISRSCCWDLSRIRNGERHGLPHRLLIKGGNRYRNRKRKIMIIYIHKSTQRRTDAQSCSKFGLGSMNVLVPKL